MISSSSSSWSQDPSLTCGGTKAAQKAQQMICNILSHYRGAQGNAKLESKLLNTYRNARKVLYSSTRLFLHGDMINNNPWYTECSPYSQSMSWCHSFFYTKYLTNIYNSGSWDLLDDPEGSLVACIRVAQATKTRNQFKTYEKLVFYTAARETKNKRLSGLKTQADGILL